MKLITAMGAMLLTTNAAFANDDMNMGDHAAMLAELDGLATQCAALGNGEAEAHIFGIQIIRVGDTCAITNGDELAAGFAKFLQSDEAPDWAGVGIWVKARE